MRCESPKTLRSSATRERPVNDFWFARKVARKRLAVVVVTQGDDHLGWHE